MSRIGAVNPKPFRVIDRRLIPIARYVPHNDLVPLLDALALKIDIATGDSAHMGQWRLPTNDFRDHRGDEPWIGF